MDRLQPSPFEAILRGIRASEAQDEGASGRIAATPWFVAETHAHAVGATADAVCARYREAGAEKAPGAEDAVAVAAPRSVETEDIRRELDLAACRTVEALQGRRRAFARENHPDGLDPALRDNATERMMVANRLIDMEIARLRPGGRPR